MWGSGMVYENREMEACYPLDPRYVQDTVCEGVSAISRVGSGSLRFTFYANRDRGDGSTERIVVAHHVWTREDLIVAMRQTERALEGLPITSPAPSGSKMLC